MSANTDVALVQGNHSTNAPYAGVFLIEGWSLALTPANAASDPGTLGTDLNWIAAQVPGTTASALRSVGLWAIDHKSVLLDKDVWYRLTLPANGPQRLRFEGLATFAEVWLDGQQIGVSRNMFLPLEINVDLQNEQTLHVVFRNLTAQLNGISGRRSRWRTALIDDARLRFVRTSLLGHMSGWCPAVETTGPWRPVRLLPASSSGPEHVKVLAGWTVEHGCQLQVRFKMTNAHTPVLICHGASKPCARDGDQFVASLDLPECKPWWPHTHGEPALYEVAVQDNGVHYPLGRTGFRILSVEQGESGRAFAISVNGRDIFMRGVCWTPPDLADLSFDERKYRVEFDLLREAHINMVRISGTMIYESEAFYRLADEYGILVWQDLPLANFDYPFEDNNFRTSIESEISHFLQATQISPSLAIVCGGSEILQQASMLGVRADIWKQEHIWNALKDHVHALRSDLIFVTNSPCGGEMPFFVDSGPGHYYGVGAYLRPLEDARRADVQFASECLAFSNVPEISTVDAMFGAAPLDNANWKKSVPRDKGATWDFEDVSAHYACVLYGVDIAALRSTNPQRYLALLRAATAEVMEMVFAEWRRSGSNTRGGLVFLWKDFLAGAGWGLVDAAGRPKSVWYALKRAYQPVQILLSDEGVNGLSVHVINESDLDVPVTISLSCLKNDGHALADGTRNLTLAAGQSECISATQILGAFFDTNYVYRFGPPAHDVTMVQMRCRASGSLLAQAFHFPQGRRNEICDVELNASISMIEGTHVLTLSCNRFAQTISIASKYYRPADNYFHLEPNSVRRIVLIPLQGHDGSPDGITLTALNGSASISLMC